MNQPVHLGALAHFVPRIISEIDFNPGDAVMSNDGHLGGLHLNDICIVAPLYADNELVGFASSMAHHLDVGGGTPGSIGLHNEIFQEGVAVPPVKIMAGGKSVTDVMRLLLHNVRASRETAGDLRAQLAAAHVAERRIGELARKYGVATLTGAMAQVLTYTARRVRSEIRRLPKGQWCATDYLDDDGITTDPIRISVCVSTREDGVHFDFADTDRQRPSSINTTFAMAFMGCAYALRVLLPPDLDVNDGFYRFVHVTAPSGTVVNSVRPAAIGAGAETGHRICETVFKALSRVVAERLAADSKGTGCNISFGGHDPRRGRYFVFYECQAGGYGARLALDGIDGVQAHTQNTENASVEETEAGYPVRIMRYELIQDSEGAGRTRGGLGIRRDYAPQVPMTFSVMADRTRRAPQGLGGGHAARPSRFVLNPDAKAEELRSKFSVQLLPGDVVSVQTGGGGGYGSPLDRDPAAVATDVIAGRISPARAAEVYGVALTESMEIDVVRTRAIRAQLQLSQLEVSSQVGASQ